MSEERVDKVFRIIGKYKVKDFIGNSRETELELNLMWESGYKLVTIIGTRYFYEARDKRKKL